MRKRETERRRERENIDIFSDHIHITDDAPIGLLYDAHPSQPWLHAIWKQYTRHIFGEQSHGIAYILYYTHTFMLHTQVTLL